MCERSVRGKACPYVRRDSDIRKVGSSGNDAIIYLLASCSLSSETWVQFIGLQIRNALNLDYRFPEMNPNMSTFQNLLIEFIPLTSFFRLLISSLKAFIISSFIFSIASRTSVLLALSEVKRKNQAKLQKIKMRSYRNLKNLQNLCSVSVCRRQIFRGQ